MLAMHRFGPFRSAFQKGERDVPAYLALLHLHDPGTQVVLDRIEVSITRRRAASAVRAMLEGRNWRPHLVAAVAFLLDSESRFETEWLWGAVRRGSWVLPQLVATSLFVDESFSTQARGLVTRGGVSVEMTAGLSPIECHVSMGPGNETQRSAKLVMSLLTAAERVPSLRSWAEEARRTSEVVALSAQDFDDAPRLTANWIERVEWQFERRGRPLQVRAT